MPAPVSTLAAPLGPESTPPVRLVTLPAAPEPVATRYSGPYRFVRGPLVSRPGGSAGAENDDVDVFLHMNRALPFGRVVVSVNGASPALTAGGAGFDQVDASTYAAARCYEITVGNTETLTHTVVHYHLGEVVTVVVRIVSHSTDENGRPIVGPPATAEARVVMGKTPSRPTIPTPLAARTATPYLDARRCSRRRNSSDAGSSAESNRVSQREPPPGTPSPGAAHGLGGARGSYPRFP